MINRTLLSSIVVISVCSSTALAQKESRWPRVRDYGGALPQNENRWMSGLNYPSDALRKGLQGNVIVSFDITVDGRVRNCVVTSSSGIRSLDRVPCPLLEKNARFKPATGDSGPVATRGSYSVAFWLPTSQ